MRTVRRVLVAIKDPQARTLAAVDRAVQLARALDAEIQLFHALSTPIYFPLGTHGEDSLAEIENAERVQIRSRLEALAGPLRKQGIPVTTGVEWDFPAGE